MAKRATRIKKEISRELKHAESAEVAQEIINEIQKDVQVKVETEPKKKLPGMTIAGSKVSYTYRYLCEQFPIATFTPEVTMGITFNGVRVQCLEGIEMHVPACFKKEYDRIRREERLAGKSLPDSGFISVVNLGIGALPPRETE